ncbi:hypothetical protein Amn_24140 [Aminobacter sp. Y103A]|uniref:hypothetical protein n=1 Tax=Aminobacter sp. Y103A TaxID=1870862 RepID=UPI00257471D8|nr:hypothetical protein [Aminobacter sp. SS-2016]BBD37534.1 hypothetical protein Amn_24140 [Aminobacter sp. SS-2016]
MADFVAVLKKTLAGMGDTTPAMRARVYDKARSTIAAKLAALKPQPPVAIAERQTLLLEEAITAVEAEFNPRVEDDLLADLETAFATIDRDTDQTTWSRTAAELDKALSEIDGRGKLRITYPSSRVDTFGGTTPRAWLLTASGAKPPEPTITEGPNFELKGSKLAGSHSFPKANEIERQSRLHEQLKRAVVAAEPMLAKVENKFPEIVGAYREYAAILDENTDEIDVVALWSVGGALLSFADSYREQNRDRTLAEPLEPQTAGALQSITRLHGAFVMGFDEGRDLVLKADEFLLNTATVEAVSDPGNALLEVFAGDKRLIESRTLKQNKPVRDYVHEYGWTTTRVGYSAYIIVRNGVVSLLKLVVGTEINVTTVTGAALAASAVSGDPNAEFIRAALPVIHQNAANMLAFFGHSPEFRAYIEWALGVLGEDDKARD